MGRKSEVSDAEESIGATPAKSSDRLDYDELIKRVSVIAQPLASRKLTKRLYRTVKKGI
jgi:H/ACA ribonucleoprotein complex subunit 2